MSDTQLPDIGVVSTTEIEGLRIRFAKGGAAIGVPVLLTAPWPESIYAFHRLLPVLEKKHPYIAVDLPGYGLSDSRPEVMSPAAMGDFIVPLMRHFGLKRAHVVALDVGTLAFLFVASARPDLFEASLSVEVRCAWGSRQASLRTSSTQPPAVSQQSTVPWLSKTTWTTRHN